MNKFKSIILLVAALTLLLVNPLQAQENEAKAPKNIIIFIGDGMGFNHVSAASLYFKDTSNGFSWQKFEQRLAMSTYHSNCSYDDNLAWSDFDYVYYQYTDSAAAATAMASGRKTYYSGLGTSGKRDYENLMERAHQRGKATGVVTSVPLSHATPAGFIIHNQSRWNYQEIALAMFSSSLDVIMGCGHPEYDRYGQYRLQDREYKFVGGKEIWDLVKAGHYGSFIETREEFQNLMRGETPERLIGIARVDETLQQERAFSDPLSEEIPYRDKMIQTVPTLAEMSLAAINCLDDDPDGFVVMIEGGAIDWAAHDEQKERMIEEVAGFDEAIGAVLDWVNKESSWDETLVVVAADHETGYITVGKGASAAEPLIGNGLRKMPQFYYNFDQHTNNLVPFYAHGVGSQKFRLVADRSDSVRGWYLDNTDFGKVILELLGEE